MRQPLALLLHSLAALACGGDPSSPPAFQEGEGVLGEWVWSGGRQRTYALHYPAGFDSSRTWPLLIGFHGFGDAGEAFANRVGLDDAARAQGFVAAWPNGVSTSWAPGCQCTTPDFLGVDDVRFVRTLIAQITDSLPVDPDSVFVAGYSHGALLTHRLACNMAGELRGAASVAATMGELVADGCAPARSVPFLFVHGTEDQSFPWDDPDDPILLTVNETVGFWRGANGCAADSTVTQLPDVVADGTTTTLATWGSCAGGAEVLFYAVTGGGHTWPGGPGPFPPQTGNVAQDFSASEEIIEFFTGQ